MDKYPYSLLKRDERGYTILLLRDQLLDFFMIYSCQE